MPDASSARQLHPQQRKICHCKNLLSAGHLMRWAAIHALEGGFVHSYSCAMLDWETLREALQAALLEAVSAEAGGRWRAAALGELYAETDSVIEAPSLFLNHDGEGMDSPGN